MGVWTVPAVVLRVIDADTIRLRLDLGWSIFSEQNCRVLGVNAPELSTAVGRIARDWAVTMLPVGLAVTFESRQLDKYGRPLGRIWHFEPRHFEPSSHNTLDYGDALLAAGHAVVFNC